MFLQSTTLALYSPVRGHSGVEWERNSLMLSHGSDKVLENVEQR